MANNRQESPLREEIELRAYELYLLRGGQDGLALEDWLAAENELSQNGAETQSSALKAKAATNSSSGRD